MKRPVLVAALALGVASSPFTSGPAVAADPYEIDVILSLTGGAAFLGSKEAQTLGIAEKTINSSGGIKGRPVKFVVHDDGTVPQNVVELTNAVVQKKGAVIIGPSIAANCNPLIPLVEKGGPVTYCLSSPVQPPTGSFMLSASTSSREFIPLTLRYFKARGWTRMGMITSTDASGQAYDRDLDAVLATADGKGIDIVDREHFNVGDVSMLAQISKLKAAAPQVVLTFGVGPSFGTFLRQSFDAGLNLPVSASAANLNAAQLEPYKAFAPKELYFVSSSGAAPDPTGTTAIKAARATFYKAFADAGVKAEYLHTIAWDPAMLIVEALRKLGVDASPLQIRDYILGLRSWSGIAGPYDFRVNPQRGLGPESNAVYRWDFAKSEPVVVPMPKTR